MLFPRSFGILALWFNRPRVSSRFSFHLPALLPVHTRRLLILAFALIAGAVLLNSGSGSVTITLRQWLARSPTVTLDRQLAAEFPALAESMKAGRATTFDRTTRRVNEHEVTGLTMRQGGSASTAARVPANLNPVEQEALRRLAEHDGKAGEFRAFFPEQYSESFVVEGEGISATLRPVGAEAAQATIENGHVVYRGAYKETDSLHALGAGRSEEFLYLKTADAPRRFEYELSEIKGAREVRIENGAVRFRDEAGRGLQIEAPWVVDALGQRRDGVAHWELGAADERGQRLLSLVITAGIDLSYPLVIDPSWSTTGAFTNGRYQHTATLLPNGKILIAGGYTTNPALKSAELYDPATDTWSVTGSLSTARSNHTATLLPNGKVLVAGGDDNVASTSSAELYDPATGTWSVTGSLNNARQYHTATLLPNGKVLVVGGRGGGDNQYQQVARAEVYDPATEQWSVTGSLNTARAYHTATLLQNGKVLVAGGIDGNYNPFSSAELYDPASGTWSVTGSLSTTRSYHTATLLPNGKVLVAAGVGGANESSFFLDSAELYDPATGTWSITGSLNTARSYHTATLLPNGKVLVAGGLFTNASKSAELYDPVSESWTATTLLNTARAYHTATLLPNGKVLVAGGLGSGILNSAELYDSLTGGWNKTGSLNTARLNHTATLLQNGKVLVVGGDTDYSGSAELYDPATGTWTATGSLNNARLNHTATLLPNGKVLVAGGAGKSITSLTGPTNAEVYDPATEKWTETGALNTARYNHTATLLPNGKVLVAGGYRLSGSGSSFLTSAELYDPATGIWTVTSPLNNSRHTHTATLLPSGKVLVAGGTSGGNVLTSAELYDPATGTWSVTGSLRDARVSHTATLLPNGKVLVAAGVNENELTSAELYDPATGTWSVTGSLNNHRFFHTATLLPNGKVLVAAGFQRGFNLLTSAELYDPATGTWTETSSLNTRRYNHTATLLPNGKVLVAGGGNNNATGIASAEVYDFASGTWSATGSLSTSRFDHTATLLPSGKILVVGGHTDGFSSDYLASAEVYDPASGIWSQTGALNTARTGHTATLLPNGKVLVAGGSGPHQGVFNPLSSAELYDPVTGTWSATGLLNTRRYNHTATLLPNGKVLVVGGNGDFVLNSAELYDPASGTWSVTGSIQGSRTLHTATLLPSGKVLVVGGGTNAGDPTPSAQLYDPATGTWTTTGSLATGLDRHTATLLPNGKVLVAGGRDSHGFVASVQLYDPATGRWTLTGSLVTNRYHHTATLLPNGKVLVTGGNFSSTANAEIYDPATGRWNATASLQTTRFDHTATLLLNGKVLVAGGNDGSGVNAIASAEVYDTGLGFAAASRPVIASLTSPLQLPNKLVLTGTHLRGFSGASSDDTRSSSTNYPVVQLLSLVNEQTLFLTSDPATNWSETSFTSQTITGFPSGPALVTVFTNGIPSDSKLIQVTGLVTTFSNLSSPTITYGNTTTTLAGKISAGSSVPTGNVSITLDGVTRQAAIQANGTFSSTFGTGTLDVSHSPYTITYSYAGDSTTESVTESQTLTVIKATATMTLGNLSQPYDGTAKAPTVVTTPLGLSYTLSYSQNNQTVAAPTNAGSYNVTATITDPNYQGSASGTLVINKAVPVITWNNPANIVFGTPLSNTQLNATASVQGIFSYDPPAGTIINVGPHQLSVTFTPTDTANYTSVTKSVSITVDQVTAAAFNLDSAVYTVNEGDGHVTITVNRTGNGAGAASVDYTTSDTARLQNCNVFNGVASSRCDYAMTVGTLRFASGEMSKTINIPLVDDAYAEGPETFKITLSNAQGENLGAVSSAPITIWDNEAVTGPNPIVDVSTFVRQQYIDFLGREPDASGYQGWQDILNKCKAGDTSCDRISVSAGFFRSPEFQTRGYFIFRFYAASLGRNPSYAEFMPDLGRVSGFLTDAQLEANKVAFVQEFMTRNEFANRYGSLSNAAFVDTLIQASGLQSHPLRGPWIDVLNNRTATRAEVLRAFVESLEVYDRFYNQAFVVMQYFGYLRRDPDSAYLQWVETLNRTGDYRALISGFLNSNEYVLRFGP